MKENVENLRNEKGEKETRRVLVSGLPEGTIENNVHIHFQKKKNGGGEIEKVELLGEGKAIVVFEESRGAEQVITQDQNIKGKIVHVRNLWRQNHVRIYKHQKKLERRSKNQEQFWFLVFLKEPQKTVFISSFKRRKMAEEKSKKSNFCLERSKLLLYLNLWKWQKELLIHNKSSKEKF